jgi:hypothetical protein
LATALTATQLLVLVEAAGSLPDYCSSGVFAGLMYMKADTTVLKYCSQLYPVQPVTITKRGLDEYYDRHWRRVPVPNANPPIVAIAARQMTTTKAPPVTTPKAATTTANAANLLDTLLGFGGGILQSACTCLEGQLTVTVSDLLSFHKR